MAVTGMKIREKIQQGGVYARPKTASAAQRSAAIRSYGSALAAATSPTPATTTPTSTTGGIANPGWGATDYGGYPALTQGQKDAYNGIFPTLQASSSGSGGGGSGSGGGGSSASPRQVREFTDAELATYNKNANSIVSRGVTNQNNIINTFKPTAITEFKPPVDLKEYVASQFDPDDPRYLAMAQEITDQAIREGKSANQVAREKYAATYQNMMDDVALQQDMALQKNEGSRVGALNRIQSLGANTGLGFGGMMANEVFANDWNANTAMNNLLQEYANERAGYGRTYNADVNETYAGDRNLDAGRTASMQKYLNETILPTRSNIWSGNEAATAGAYGINQKTNDSAMEVWRAQNTFAQTGDDMELRAILARAGVAADAMPLYLDALKTAKIEAPTARYTVY
jgi:hypothetical protein